MNYEFVKKQHLSITEYPQLRELKEERICMRIYMKQFELPQYWPKNYQDCINQELLNRMDFSGGKFSHTVIGGIVLKLPFPLSLLKLFIFIKTVIFMGFIINLHKLKQIFVLWREVFFFAPNLRIKT